MLLYEYVNNSFKFNYTVFVFQGGAEESIQVEFAQPNISILITIYF